MSINIIDCVSKRPDVFSWTAMCQTQTINIDVINGVSSASIVKTTIVTVILESTECVACTNLIANDTATDLTVGNWHYEIY